LTRWLKFDQTPPLAALTMFWLGLGGREPNNKICLRSGVQFGGGSAGLLACPEVVGHSD
jgi:hypothetical protein